MYFFISQECKEGKHRLEQGVLRGLTKVHTSLFQTLYHRRGLHSCFCKEFEVYYTSAFDFSLPFPPPPPRPRLPHLTSPSTPQWTLGSFMTPRHTRSMLSRCSTSRSQSQRQQLSRHRRYFTLLFLQEMFSLPVCSAGILHVLVQVIVFSMSFKGPHVKWLSNEHL